MNKNAERFIMFCLGMMMTAIIVGMLKRIDPAADALYRQGQIDALNGVIHYELQTQPDGSKIWKRKEK